MQKWAIVARASVHCDFAFPVGDSAGAGFLKGLGAQCENVPANNPKGIETSSPRLASNAYLGCAFGNGNKANGVAAEVMPAVRNGLAPTALRLGRFDGR